MLSRFDSRSRAVISHATFRGAVVAGLQQPAHLMVSGTHTHHFSTATEPMKTQTIHLKPLERTYSGSDAKGARTSMHLQVDDHPGKRPFAGHF
jgi:hypothetical protein